MKTVVLISKEDIKTAVHGKNIGIGLGPDLLASITIEAMDELVEDYKTLRALIMGTTEEISSSENEKKDQ